MISSIHLSGPVVRVKNLITQRCLLCGHILLIQDIDNAPQSGEDEDGTPLHHVVVIKPLSLVRITDRPVLFGLMPTERTVECLREMGDRPMFDGDYEMPPGTCVLHNRKSVNLSDGPLEGGWYHAPPGKDAEDVFEIQANGRAHRYRLAGGVGVYLNSGKWG